MIRLLKIGELFYAHEIYICLELGTHFPYFRQF